MHKNEQLIKQFYDAFQKKDHRFMQDSYLDQAEFSDPVFQNLNANEVRAMWQMLVTSSADLKVSCHDVSAEDKNGKCIWEAWYTFTSTGRKVHNIIHATFEFSDGKILKHKDNFDFWRWSKMALGTPGLLLGWTSYLKNKVRKTAMRRLNKFISHQS